MRTTLVTGPDALADTDDVWARLERLVDPPPFLTRAWARAWLEHLGRDCEPWILLLGDEPRALVPLARRNVGGLRCVVFLGHGRSDYLGPLCSDPGPDLARAVADALRAESRHFDLLMLRGLAEPEDQLQLLRAGLDRSALRRYELCPRITCEGSWETYLATRQKKFRANVKRAARRAGGYGSPDVAIEAPTPGLFEELVAVERESWKWEHGRSQLRHPAVRAFIRDVVLSEGVRKELWTLRTSGELAAFALVLTDGGTRYYYLPSFRARLPDTGSHLLGEIVRATFGSAFRAFDFLQGDEPYKLAWANDSRQVYELVTGSGLLGRGAFLAQQARWRLARSRGLQRLWSRLHTYLRARSSP